MQLVNTKLLSNPINWFTVMLMVLIAAVGGHLLFSLYGIEPATQES
jgi:hypothetical protein